MSKGKFHHITINGKPLCDCEGHHSGLLSRSPPITFLHRGQELRLSCSFRSKARARSAWQELAKHRYWKSIKVVAGECPLVG